MTAARLAALLCLLPGLAAAQDDVTWEDPDLASAVKAADLIVLGQVSAVDSDAATFVVQRTLAGPARDAASVRVTGLHHPELDPEGPPVAKGDRAYLLLQGDPKGPLLRTPTATFGRFPLKRFGPEDKVVASLWDTLTRLPVAPDRFEAFLLGIRGGPTTELLAATRAELERPDADPTACYAALRAIALFGGSEDGPRVLKLLQRHDLQPDARWVVRMAAADALGRAGGADAVKKLVEMVRTDAVPAVRSAAVRALAPALVFDADAPVAREATSLLAKLALEAGSEPITLFDAEDPRRNEIDSLLLASLKTLASARPEEGVGPALRALERKDDLSAVVAGLTFFEALDDPAHAGAVAWRMRDAGAEDELLNRLFARTLQALTGESLGQDRERWVKWWQARTLKPPQGPERPR